ncbi:antibiotic biosynthesis monooxygenase family protein [Streptomyces poriticola]|uniref:antibiotic biosynthesis monooxygenase family protein n=1 Tax=Streptomyces poriticola TaxID=3120506 RepID=UPI002FCDF18D
MTSDDVTSDEGRVRVVRLLRVRAGREAAFLRHYHDVRARAERFPGHLGEQLCRSLDDPAQWLLTSEWESLAAIKGWRTDPEHAALVRTMNDCLHGDRSTTVYRVMVTVPG